MTAPAQNLSTLPQALGVLTAMITPALLVLGTGTLIASTSVRLGRVVDRVRVLSDQLEALVRPASEVPLLEERRTLFFDQLEKLASRARLLQLSMSAFYSALATFIGTSVAIGVMALLRESVPYLPVTLALAGMILLLVGAMLLLAEAHMAFVSVHQEMRFLSRLGQEVAPTNTLRRRKVASQA